MGAVPGLEVVIEIPRGSCLKRGHGDQLDFLSPFPCLLNYGAIYGYIGGDGDLLDAMVLGPRLARGTRVRVTAYGAIGFTDRNVYDDKLVCSQRPLTRWQRRWVLLFFQCYAFGKRLLNFCRGCSGRTVCEGWGDARAALARARPRQTEKWSGLTIPF